MRIEEDDNRILTVDDWKLYAPPKRSDQWAEGRSAYELARAWCEPTGPAMPEAISDLCDTRPETRDLTVDVVHPELRVVFDSYGGEPRNADLAFVGQAGEQRVAVTVEAKADEPFAGTVSETLSDALERHVSNPKSNGVARVVDLSRALFQTRSGRLPVLASLRYQLLTTVAGTIAYAVKNNADLAVLLVHEFVTDKTSDEKHERNASDLSDFLSQLSGEPGQSLSSGSLFGPIRIPGNPLFQDAPPLLIGKVTTNLR